MYFQTFCSILLASYALVTQAFVIPPDTLEGVYSVTRDADGIDVHTLLSKSSMPDDDANTTPNPNAVDANGLKTYCGCGFTLNHANTDAAVADIKRQLNNGDTPPKHSFYAIKGTGSQRVVAFVCNRSPDHDYNYPTGVYTTVIAHITKSCGSYIAGSGRVHFQRGPQDFAVLGYQRYANGDDFCAHSTDSKVSSCPK